MTFERRGYQPLAFYSTVEQALAAKADPSKTAVFIDIKKGGFTAEEVAAIPDNAKTNDYHIGYMRQLFDRNEGIFTKGFWTSSEGLKKVARAGLIKAEPVTISLEAAQWLLSKREGGGPVSPVAKPEPKADPVPTKAEVSAAVDAAPLESSSGPEVKSSPQPTPTPVSAEVLPPETVSMPKATARRAEPSLVVDVPAHEPAEDTKGESGSSVFPAASPTPTNTSSAREEAVALLESLDTKPQTTPTTPPLRNEPKVFEMADLQPLEARFQEKFAALKASIAPKTLTVVVDDSASIDAIINNLNLYKDFNKAFAEQASKTQAVLEQVGKLGLDQPSQGGVFKKKQDDALRLIDTLSFSKSDLATMADKIELANGRYLPGAMREAVNNAAPLLDAIKADLEEARNIIRNARRVNPSPKVTRPNPEEKSQVVTGSVAKMPRLGKELSVDPRKLESIGHAMVDANVPDQEMNGKYKAIMSEFVRSYVSTFSKIRKEIYEARMDGSNLNSMQKEKFTYLAEALGQHVQVSDLMEIGSSSSVDRISAHFGRVVDGSPFQKSLNQMKEEFSKALMKEIEKTPGTENTDTTYIAYKRHRYEKSGITEFLKS
jgi:hypothetical protein